MDRQRVGLWATLLFAAAAAVGVLFQVFFIGAFRFGKGDVRIARRAKEALSRRNRKTWEASR